MCGGVRGWVGGEVCFPHGNCMCGVCVLVVWVKNRVGGGDWLLHSRGQSPSIFLSIVDRALLFFVVGNALGVDGTYVNFCWSRLLSTSPASVRRRSMTAGASHPLVKKCVLYSTNRAFPGAPKPSQRVLLQATGLGAQGGMGAICPDPYWFRSWGTSTAERHPR